MLRIVPVNILGLAEDFLSIPCAGMVVLVSSRDEYSEFVAYAFMDCRFGHVR